MQCIYTMDYHSAIKKNETMPFAAAWMDPESVIPSEISQTEKENPLYVESKKPNDTNEFTKHKETHRLR